MVESCEYCSACRSKSTCSKSHQNQFGRSAVITQQHYNIAPFVTVAPPSSRPAPQVESAILRLVPRPDLAIGIDEHDAFAALVRQAFSQRRKTLKNTLKGYCDVKQIDAAGIDPGKRPQELAVDDYIRLFKQLH